MNDHVDPFLNDDKLSEAFAVDAPSPTTEHLERLRKQIASRTKVSMNPESATSPGNKPRMANMRRFRLPVSFAAIATVVLIALLATRPFLKDAAAGLQDTLKTTREALWIHGSTTVEHAGTTVIAESWCSPAERVVAFRSPRMMHFVDYEQGVQSSYTEKHGKVFQWKADPSTEGLGREFVHALLNDQDLKSSFPFHEVSEVSKTFVDVGGKSAAHYSFQVQMKSNPEVRWKTTIRTHATSGRITHWEDHHAGGMHVKVIFDYPDNGPRDIFELGAPSTAKVIEIATPDSDLFGK